MLTGLVEPLIRLPELMAEAGLSSDYYWDVMGLATSREPTFLRYIAGGVINLFGTLEIQPCPGEYRVDVDASGVVPGQVAGRILADVMSFDALIVGDSNERWPPPGHLCACIVDQPMGSPRISASFDGLRLILDYSYEPQSSHIFEWGTLWIDGKPPQYAVFDDHFIYHIEATVVPLPAAGWMLASTLAWLGCAKRREHAAQSSA